MGWSGSERLRKYRLLCKLFSSPKTDIRAWMIWRLLLHNLDCFMTNNEDRLGLFCESGVIPLLLIMMMVTWQHGSYLATMVSSWTKNNKNRFQEIEPTTAPPPVNTQYSSFNNDSKLYMLCLLTTVFVLYEKIRVESPECKPGNFSRLNMIIRKTFLSTLARHCCMIHVMTSIPVSAGLPHSWMSALILLTTLQFLMT